MKIIYLDIDGCINHFSGGHPRRNTGWNGEWRAEIIADEKVQWSTELVEDLNRLSKEPDVFVVWATDWRLEATESLCPVLGLEGQNWDILLPSQEEIESSDYKYFWKADYIEAHVRLHMPDKAIWIDDNARSFFMYQEWASQLPTEFMDVVPNKHHGLSVNHMKAVRQFLSG